MSRQTLREFLEDHLVPEHNVRLEYEALLMRIDKLEDALQKIKNWADAYPLDIFPEPDFKKAHKILTAEGMTLDAISASAMRHVITGVKEIVENALTGE